MKDNLNIEISPIEISNFNTWNRQDRQRRGYHSQTDKAFNWEQDFQCIKELKARTPKIFIREYLTPKTSSFFKEIQRIKKGNIN